MRRAIRIAALLATVATFVLATSVGLVLLLVPNSGERTAGVLLVLTGCLALGSILFLLNAAGRGFRGAAGLATAAVATLFAFTPAAALAGAAIFFAGLPLDSVMPLADWSILALGVLFALGACAILALGYERLARKKESAETVVETKDLDAARRQLRDAFERDRARPLRHDHDDDIRVTRV